MESYPGLRANLRADGELRGKNANTAFGATLRAELETVRSNRKKHYSLECNILHMPR